MPATIQVGTVLIDDSPLMTQRFGLESEAYSGTWSMVKLLDGFALDRRIHGAGWNFFFMAAEVKAMFFGRCWSEEDPERIDAHSTEGKAATLQWP